MRRRSTGRSAAPATSQPTRLGEHHGDGSGDEELGRGAVRARPADPRGKRPRPARRPPRPCTASRRAGTVSSSVADSAFNDDLTLDIVRIDDRLVRQAVGGLQDSTVRRREAARRPRHPRRGRRHRPIRLSPMRASSTSARERSPASTAAISSACDAQEDERAERDEHHGHECARDERESSADRQPHPPTSSRSR